MLCWGGRYGPGGRVQPPLGINETPIGFQELLAPELGHLSHKSLYVQFLSGSRSHLHRVAR